MNHLTEKEIIDFVTMSDLNEETKALAAKLNSHIFKCDECLKKVKAFQNINEGFSMLLRDTESKSNTNTEDLQPSKDFYL